MNDDEALARSQRAKSDYREFEAAFEKVKAAIIAEMIGTTPTHTDKILRLHAAAQTVDAVRMVLLSVVAGGEVAAHALALAGLNRP